MKNVDTDNSDLPAWHKNELNFRLEELKSGKSEFFDFDTAMDDIEKNL